MGLGFRQPWLDAGDPSAVAHIRAAWCPVGELAEQCTSQSSNLQRVFFLFRKHNKAKLHTICELLLSSAPTQSWIGGKTRIFSFFSSAQHI
jgi:hypothetical protein